MKEPKNPVPPVTSIERGLKVLFLDETSSTEVGMLDARSLPSWRDNASRTHTDIARYNCQGLAFAVLEVIEGRHQADLWISVR